MVYILAIPLYYQSSSFPFPPSPDHPTTTARYIAFLPTPSPVRQDLDYAIAKDAVAWGWKVYDADPSAPKMREWWKKYKDTVSKKDCTWDEDLWRIWQREHGVRILERDVMRLKGKEHGMGKESAMQSALGKLKKAGLRIRRGVVGREGVEYELRQFEQRKREARLQQKRRQAAKVEWANANREAESSTLSLPASFTERLERFDSGKGEDCEADVGIATDVTMGSSAAPSGSLDPMVLTRHSWLYRG